MGVGEAVARARFVVAAVLSVLCLATLAGCGGDGGTESSGAPSPSSAPDPGAEAGASLMAGLTAPEGTSLVGATFERPASDGPAAADTYAVLTVDGDPFAAWDDLAAQSRALGMPLPGSGVCQWFPGPLDQAGAGASPVPASSPRPDGFDTLWCGANAYAGEAGGNLTVYAQLEASPAGAELGVQVGVEAQVAESSQEPRSYPEIDPGPAAESARADVPEVRPAPPPGVGEPFGRENNCFEAGYDRLEVPPGARLVGGGTARIVDDFAAVLAVDDAEAALDDLAAQLDPTGPEAGDAVIDVGQVDAPGGRIWQLSGSVSAGGGSCWVTSTPDGALLLVTTHSD